MGSIADSDPGLSLVTPDGFGFLLDAQPVKLMQVLKKDGEWIFGDEIEASFQWESRSEVWLQCDDLERRASWWQWSLRTSKNCLAISSRHLAIVARWPWSQFEVNVARFRPGSKKEHDRKPTIVAQRFADESALFAWLENLPQDYWDTDGRLVARFNQPRPRQFDDRNRRKPRANADPRLVFGVCEQPLEQVTEELLNHPKALELLDWTMRDKLRFWYKGAGRPGLLSETKDEATTLLLHSLRMAIAGPEDDSAKWANKPVMELASFIYRTLINNLNRQLMGKRSRQRFLTDDLPDDHQ